MAKADMKETIGVRWQITLVNIVMNWSQGGGMASVTNFEVYASMCFP